MALATNSRGKETEVNCRFGIYTFRRHGNTSAAKYGAQRHPVAERYGIGKKQQIGRETRPRVIVIRVSKRAVRDVIAGRHGLIDADRIHAINRIGHEGCEFPHFFEAAHSYVMVKESICQSDTAAPGNAHPHQVEE